ncbi:glycosyltransferase, group 1 family protein [Turicibacter sp. HGF1]|uniref:glycosyltransferase family 4 protein n=1 Tax=Turicibacter sp. HGF1 TaxID=910310 RepID=UPI0001FD88E9|nr:glycosyltransferase family 4 protein [Turicibacter sp. HGF1]EGC90830.1 glycosyltransferase, group 1 family protein [Turicibacter sp. HGF1]
MRVLLVNKFLYPKGGAETYVLAVGKMLKENGHEVQYFGLENKKNTVGNRKQLLVSDMDFSKGIMKNLKAPFRIIYNFEARKKIRGVLNDFRPDVIHLNNIQYHLTPSIILEIAKWKKKNKSKCRIIYTAHDYQLVCPSHGMFDIDLKPCEKCLDGRYIHCYNTKCLKNSKLKSLLGTMDGYFWKYSKAYNYVDNYICCSNFLKEKLDTQERFKDKTIEMHNFKDIVPFKNIEKKGYILEFGHLSKDKGTDTLIEAAKLLPEYKFVFIGYGPSIEKMKNISNIEYLGFKTGEELYKIIAEAAVSVCPSEMYENCPFSVIESIALGTPVIGAKIGGIPELIEDGKTGELFEPGNVQELVQKIKKIMLDDEEYDSYVENCKLSHCETSETYYKKLIKIYRGDFKC